MNIRTCLLPLFAAPALLALSERVDSPSFGPNEGLTLTKTYSNVEESVLDEMSVAVNGEEMDPSMTAMEQDVSNQTTVELTDVYGSTAGGRPTRVRRTFETISSDVTMDMSNAMMGEMSMEMVGESELEGETVVFTWDEGEGSYVLEFAEDSGAEEELLEDVEEDTDLRDFLPTVEVSEGDTWEVEPQALRKVLAFGGDLKLEMESSEMNDMLGPGSGPSPSANDYLGELSGSISAEYAGSRDEDGAAVAVIRLTFEIDSAKDMTEMFQAQAEAMEAPEGMDMSMEYNSADMEFELEGEATLLWDLAGGHLYSFELSGEAITTIDMSMAMSMGGLGDMESDISMTMKGSMTVSLTASAGDR